MNQLANDLACYHCGRALQDQVMTVDIGDVAQPVCSPGCQAAAARIHELSLDRFYAFRDKFVDADDLPGTDEQMHRDPPRHKSDDERRLEFEATAHRRGDATRISLRVPDIRCAACTWLIENSLRQREDVARVVTNLAERVVTVDFDSTDVLEIVRFVEDLGFTVLPDRASFAKQAQREERKSMLSRLGIAGIGMAQVMMYAIATYVAGNDGIEPAYEALTRWASLAITTPIVFYSAMPFHRGALRDLRHRTLGMDVPVSLAILAAYTLSIISTLTLAGEVYFDSVSMFTFLLLIGRYVELGSRHRYEQSQLVTESLMPTSALVDGRGRVPVASLVPGDVVTVHPGEIIPADGIIEFGETSVSESAFTGESRAIEKNIGQRVLAGADNLDGEIQVRVDKCHDEFVLTTISRLYRDASAWRPRFSVLSDQVARYFVAGILLIAGSTAAYWWTAGATDWFSIALSVLVVSCPCALSLATPVAYTVALSTMRREGIVVANGTLLERLNDISTIVFDKTGTLTAGKLRIEETRPMGTIPADEALQIAAALEQHSRHPIATAFEAATGLIAESVEVRAGEGVSGVIDGVTYRIGKPGFALPGTKPPAGEGVFVLLASHEPIAWFRLSDQLREEAPSLLDALGKDYSLRLFTGDTTPEAWRIAGALCLDEVAAELSPEDKFDKVKELQRTGHSVLMVGDGVNDTAAMAVADASIAVSPVDIVVQDAADATLVRSSLDAIPVALRFATRVRRIIAQNLSWALGYNLLVIPLAVMGMIAPWVAALGMSASSVLVVLNANRLQKV